MSKVTYEARKAAGLCVSCGEEKDRADRVQCSKCRNKGASDKAAARIIYKKYKICPRCGNKEVFENYASCLDCLEKEQER